MTDMTPKMAAANARNGVAPFPGTEYYIPGEIEFSPHDVDAHKAPIDWQEFPGAEYFGN